MKRFFLILLVLFCFSVSVSAEDNGFLNRFAEKIFTTKNVIFNNSSKDEDLDLSEENISKTNGKTIRTDLSPEEIELLKISVEKRKVIAQRKKWNIDGEYCMNLKYYTNFKFCLEQMEDQALECPNQLTYGNNVYIDLNKQLLYAVKDCKLVVYSITTTGKNDTPTPTGDYKIYSRRGPHYMQGEWFVTKAFYFRGGYALHDAGWRVGKYWEKEARAYHGSHGCVNLPNETINTLWDNFDIGDNVHIYYEIPEDIMTELNDKISGVDPIVAGERTVEDVQIMLENPENN